MSWISLRETLSPRLSLFLFFITCLLAANLLYAFISYKRLTSFDYAYVEAKLVSSKERVNAKGGVYFSLLFSSPQISFRAFSDSDMKRFEGSKFGVVIQSSSLTFLDTLSTPRLKIKSLDKISTQNGLQKDIKEFIASQHESDMAKEVYLNLFLNVETGTEVEEFVNVYGLGAFFALSGLNVALLSALIFAIISFPISALQNRFFPYFNRRFWVSLLVFAFLCVYAYATDFTPSFVRAVAAYWILLYFSFIGESALSYRSLAIIIVVCISFFPQFLFSIGFWLSVYGVFLIFLFLENTTLKTKLSLYFTLSAWLFAAMSPVVHYLFAVFTNAHFLNPIFGVVFDLFYPLSFCLHLIGFGGAFDDVVDIAVKSACGIDKKEFLTPTWFFVAYITISLAATLSKSLFFCLNIFIFGYLFGSLWFLFLK